MAFPEIPQFFLRIAIPSPLRQCFEYLPPADVPLPLPGTRVRVPFGKQIKTGIVISTSTEAEFDLDKILSVLEVLDCEPLLDTSTLALYKWASDYYMFPLGLALQTSLPKSIREGGSLVTPTKLVWQLTDAGRHLPLNTLQHAPLQQQVVNMLLTYQLLSTAEISALLGKSARTIIEALASKELLQAVPAIPVHTLKNPALPKQKILRLNEQQTNALTDIKQALGVYKCFLLEGITGSGKTEIYLQLITEVLNAGQQVLVLVPEISLTPQTISRFELRFHSRIVAFHSGLTDKQRLEGWMAARNGSADIIIGTRSAVFTPLPRLGLIIVDEEHDNSYKQQEGFRYSARDVAIFRANTLKIPIVLGSATPALESLHNALCGRYHLLTLSQRAGAAQLPQVQLLDLKLQEIREGFSQTLLQNIRQQLSRNRQVLVFLNRRGFAPLLLCRACGWVAECPRCERSYTLHHQPAGLRCHHCDASKVKPKLCPSCGSNNLAAMGLGTERSEILLQQEFPDYPIIRIDRDTTRTVSSLSQIMATIHSGVPCILIGTQMLAKGHHFDRVALVAVLDADSGLFSADFRGQENLGQLLTQVAGRAGRSEEPGHVLIQTYHPQHPVLQQLMTGGYSVFARALLEQRKEGNLPPYVHFLLLRAEGSLRELPLLFLEEARKLALKFGSRDLHFFGPMVSPLGKKAGQFRAQLIIQASKRSSLHCMGKQLILALAALPQGKKVRWHMDVDPIDFT